MKTAAKTGITKNNRRQPYSHITETSAGNTVINLIRKNPTDSLKMANIYSYLDAQSKQESAAVISEALTIGK